MSKDNIVAHMVGYDEPASFGVRRRCTWCARVLRGWQLNACRTCKRSFVLDSPGPPFGHLSQADASPDRWRWSRRNDDQER